MTWRTKLPKMLPMMILHLYLYLTQVEKDTYIALLDLSGKPSGMWLLTLFTIKFMPFSFLWAAGLEAGVTLAERK